MAGHSSEKEKQLGKPSKKGWSDTPEIRTLSKLFETKLIYIFIIIAFGLFLITRSSIFSMLTILTVIFLLISESLVGISRHGAKKEIFEILTAIIMALVIWFGAGFILSTPAPLNAIVSCSMLPNLERGDLVILQGAEPNGIDVYTNNFDYTDISATVEGVGTFYTKTSLAQYCAYSPNSVSPPCIAYWESPEKLTERYGPLEFRYGWCMINSGGVLRKTPCAKSVSIHSEKYEYGNLSGDTIVYVTLPTDEFSKPGGIPKEIIHRVFLKVHSNEKTYYITKGDNNAFFDIQYNNSPPTPERITGKVLVRIPYLGYFKLFLYGFFSDPVGCDRVFVSR